MKAFYQTLTVIIICLAIMIFGDSCYFNPRSGQRTGQISDTLNLSDSTYYRAKRFSVDSNDVMHEVMNVCIIKVPFGYRPTDTIIMDHTIYRLMERLNQHK